MNNPTSIRKRRVPAQADAAAPVIRWSTLFRLAAILGAVFVVAAGSAAFFEFVVWRRLPPELVGKWVVVGGPQEGATFDFFRNGKLAGVVNNKGSEAYVDADVRIDGKDLYSTTQNPTTKIPETRRQVIRTLTAKDLVLVDEQGGVLTLERAD